MKKLLVMLTALALPVAANAQTTVSGLADASALDGDESFWGWDPDEAAGDRTVEIFLSQISTYLFGNVPAASIDLTTDVTGLLPPANGGLGFDVTASGNGALRIDGGAVVTASDIGDFIDDYGITGTPDGTKFVRDDGTLAAVPTGGLGTDLSSVADEIQTDSGTLEFSGTGGTNNEGFNLDFETTANTVDVLPINGANVFDFTDWTLNIGALDVTTLTPTTLQFEGATADDFETAFAVVDPTADRTVTLPDASGTVVMHDTAQTLTNKVIATGSNTVTLFTEIHPASHTLSAAECYGAVYYVTAAPVVLTLPPVAAGMSLTVISRTGNVVTVDADGGDLIWLDGTALDDGDSVDSPGALGDVAVFTYYDSTGWFCSSNDWVDGGP